MRSRWLGPLVAAAVAFGGFAGPLAAQASGAGVSPDDALLLETRLGPYRLGEGVRGYATPASPDLPASPGSPLGSGSCLIFADVAATLDLAIDFDPAAGTARGWAFVEADRIAIDRRAGTLRLRDRVSALAAGTIRDTPEGWCVDTAALSTWLGVSLDVDQSNALLFVRSNTKLPVERAAERRARAASIRPASAAMDIAKLPRVKLPYLLWRTPALDTVLTVNGVRDARTGARGGVRYEMFASGEALRMSVDARLASDDRGIPQTLRARAYRSDPEGRLPLGATHVAIGDVGGFASPLVAQAPGGRGALVTNRPLDRADSFDRTSFRGELPVDWDAELYRNGQLLGFAQNRIDGRYEFLDVPLLYGANRFEVVLYGPQGQIRRRAERVTVGTDSIPVGKTHYWAGFSQDDHDLLRFGRDGARGERQGMRGWRGTIGAEHGVDTLTSVSAQLHTLVMRGERLTFVEGAVRRGVGPALIEMSIAYERSGGIAARAQMLAQFGDTYVSAESIRAMRGFRSDRIEAGTTGRHTLAIDHGFLIARIMVPTHLEARYVERQDAPATLEAAARVSANLRDISVTAGLDWQSQRARGRDPPGSASFGGTDTFDRRGATLLVNGRLGRVRLRGEGRYRLSGEDRGFESASFVGEWGASERSQWRAELGYDATVRRARAAIGYSRRFDRFAIGGNAEAASDGSVAAGVNVAFSVGPGSSGGLRVTSGKLGSAGTAIARVFRDLNDDGLRQTSEPFEAGVQLTAGNGLAGGVTNARGETTVDELAPFRAVAIGVDPSSLVDPLIQPKMRAQSVVPRPGVAFAVDIPLVGAGEVEGTFVDGGGAGMEGVELELVDARGAVAARQLTDFDGFFLFDGIPYGTYAMRIAALSAAAAKLSPALDVKVTVGGAAPVARLGRVVARSNASVAVAAGG